MTPLLVRAALLLTCGLGGALLLIGAAPFEAAPLQAAYLPPDCPAPCVLGIAIGADTVQSATNRLMAEPGLEAQVQYRLAGHLRYQMLNWSGYLFYPFQRGGLLDMADNPAADGVTVQALFLRPPEPPSIGALVLAFGPPERLAFAYWYHDLGTRASLILHWYYAEGQVTFITRHLCPVVREAFWGTPILSVRYSGVSTESLPEMSIPQAMGLRQCRAD
jgi:hypothetical protein